MTEREPVQSSRSPKTPSTQKASAVGTARTQAREGVRGLTYEEGQKALSPATADASKAAGAPKPAELGSALVLSQDAGIANTASATVFAVQIAAKAAQWGLTFDLKCVRLATDPAGAIVVALDWPAGLGAAPQTRVMPDPRMTPVDARFAMAAVPVLPGWKKLPARDRDRLNALLGGETNAVSAATRDYLRPKYLDLKSRPEAEQKAALSATIGHQEATPSLVSEPVETVPVEVKVSGPTEVQQYEFRGTKADAHVFTATYGDGTSLKVVAPKAPDPAYHQYTVTQAAQAARYLSRKMREVLKEIVLNPVENPDDAYWAAEYDMPDFHSFMTAGRDGVVTIYPTRVEKGGQPAEESMRGTMIHEFGHTWAFRKWGEDTKKGKWVDWKKAMKSDGVSVSRYAGVDIAEDVSETIQVYGSTKGKPKYEEYKKIIPARMAILEKELGDLGGQEARVRWTGGCSKR